MSLDWNATKIANLDERWENDDDRNDIAHFAYALMAISIPSVTEKNVAEVYTRIRIFEALNGPIRYTRDDRSVYNNYDFIKSMVGYHTNVSRMALGQWTKAIAERQLELYK